MKLPDEIKRGLEHCINGTSCRWCPYCEECAIASDCNPMHKDLQEYIKQLRDETAEQAERIKQLETERDAAVENIRGDCVYCLHLCEDMAAPSCFDCANKGYYRWEWRGVQREDGNA